MHASTRARQQRIQSQSKASALLIKSNKGLALTLVMFLVIGLVFGAIFQTTKVMVSTKVSAPRGKIGQNMLANAGHPAADQSDEKQQPVEMGCHWAQSGLILPTIHVVSTTKTLDEEAAKVDQVWSEKERCLTRSIVTASKCAELASHYPGLRNVYDRLPTAVMQADVCRMIAVYFLGGAFMDVNVEWREPAEHWWISNTELMTGRASSHTVEFGSWFFAAKRGHRCLHRALEMVVERGDRTWDAATTKASQQFAHNIFSDAMNECGAVPQFTEDDMLTDKFFYRSVLATLLAGAEEEIPIKPGCEWTANSVIPPKINLIWKSKTLFEESAELDKTWRSNEPCFQRNIITDNECSALASRFPGLRPSYDKVPMNVMRADICRVLVVYYLGGVYMDLDVAWKQPLKTWWNTTTELLTGREKDDGSWYCNWFFAAKRGNKCMHRVLELITERINRTWDKSVWEAKSHLVHKTTGPEVFADALKECGAVPQLGEADVTTDKIQHLYGSHHWRKSKGYTSWTEERAKLGGWKKMLAFRTREKGVESYLTRNPEELVLSHKPLSEYQESSVLLLSEVKQRTYRLPGAEVGGPMLAIDNYMESYSELNDDGDPNWWEMTFAEPLHLNNPNMPNTNTLYCVRVLGRRDDHESISDRMVGMGIALFQNPGVEVFKQESIPVVDGQILRVRPTTNGENIKVDRLRVFRKGYLAIAEVQVFTDRECSEYRTLVTSEQKGRNSLLMLPMPTFNPDFDGLARKLFYLMGRRTYFCPHMRWLGEFMDDDALWPICTAGYGATRGTPYAKHLPLFDPEDSKASPLNNGRKPAVVAFGYTPDQIMEKDLAELQFDVHTFDEWYRIKKIEGVDVTVGIGNVSRHGIDLQTDGSIQTSSTLMRLPQIIKHIGVEHVSVLRLDCKGREWGVADSIVQLAKEKRIDHLMLELHMEGTDDVWNEGQAQKYIAAMEKLHEEFYLVSARQDNRGGVLHHPFVLFKWMKIVMIRKSLVDGIPPGLPPASCEWTKSSSIPPVIYNVWKNNELFSEAAKIDAEWKAKEPCFTRKIVSDDECSELASRFPNLRPLYDRLPLNVMRADICRVLVVYYNGGTYMDLDVAWKQSLETWWAPTNNVLLGYATNDKSTFANWLFAANKENQCLHNALQLMTKRIDRNWDASVLQSPQRIVELSTGTSVFTEAMKSCGAKPTLTQTDVTEEKVQHLFASKHWLSTKGYSSWTAERAKLGGWKSMHGLRSRPLSVQQYFTRDPEELVRPWSDLNDVNENVLLIKNVSMERPKTVPFDFAGPEKAIDNYFPTYAQPTTNGSWWQVVLQKPLEMEAGDGSFTKKMEMLYCVRVLGIKDDAEDAARRMHGVTLQLKLGDKLVFTQSKAPVIDGQILLYRTQADDAGVKFDTIRLSKKGDPLRVAEVQLFTEPTCKVYRRLATKDQSARKTVFTVPPEFGRTYLGSAKRFYNTMSTVTHYCNRSKIFGEESDDANLWSMCVTGDALYAHRVPMWLNPAANPKVNKPIVLAFGRTTNMVLEKDFAELGYTVHSFDPSYKFLDEEGATETPFGVIHKHGVALTYTQRDDVSYSHPTASMNELVTKYGGDHISVVKINGLRDTQWDAITSLCYLAAQKKVDHVLLDFKIDAPLEKTFRAKLPELYCLEEQFYVTSGRININGGNATVAFTFGDDEKLKDEWPTEVQASLVRKSLVLDIAIRQQLSS